MGQGCATTGSKEKEDINFWPVSAAPLTGPYLKYRQPCACSDQAWLDVEETHNWYSMTVFINETAFVGWEGGLPGGPTTEAFLLKKT